MPACYGFQDCFMQCPWPRSRPPLTHASPGNSWTLTGKSGSVSCGDTAPFSWVLVAQGFVCALQESFFRNCGSSVIKSHWPSKSNSLGVLSPFARSPSWEICCRPWNFCNSAKTFCYNCSPALGSFAQQLCGGATGDLLQENLRHTPCLPRLLQPEPLSLRQATDDCTSTGDPQTLKGRSGSVSCGVPGSSAQKV